MRGAPVNSMESRANLATAKELVAEGRLLLFSCKAAAVNAMHCHGSA